ncbi:MAG: hypothetical protein ABF381_09800 [Akkermansiaceae bacterium]
MAKNRGERVFRVHAEAGRHELLVVVKNPVKTIRKKVKAGQALDFEVSVLKDYKVSGYHGKFLVDRESALKKTELQIQ